MSLRAFLTRSHVKDIVNKQENKYFSNNKLILDKLMKSKFGDLVKQNVGNILAYKFTDKELNVLSYGLNFHYKLIKWIKLSF